jgi:hypothetical protein
MDSEADLVEILAPRAQGMVRWEPQVKDETLALVEHLGLGTESRETLINEAAAILSRCLPPDGQPGSITGLVVGYVQSGKTMSFTTVTALARDNGYRLVIVIGGSNIQLVTQSTERLEQDLRWQDRSDHQWQHVSSKTLSTTDQTAIRDALADWRDSMVPPSQLKTVLITIMKHHGHLAKVIDALKEIDLTGVPALVIDDEADQASLNARVKQSEESTTYQRLRELRACLPSHSFLQYTATPQAPLLINIIDTLSPHFAEVLTPGREYVGGADFFLFDSPYVEIIPDSALGTKDEPLTEPPESLLFAMQTFFLGVAAGYELEHGHGSRSMIVHPSQQVEGHRIYSGWVNQTRNLWQQLLKDDASTADHEDLIESFRKAYQDLERTASDLPSFETLVARLPYAVRSTRVETVNASRGTTPQVKWQATYAHIIIGGQVMDRGFTVEGLTVSYMPRPIGVGNADTVQQRARFFGYKRRYLGYCRVFLSNSSRDAYMRYVDHEEHMRQSLIAHRESGRPLHDWKRVFRLDKKLKPTRDAVLDLEYMRGSFGEGWIAPYAPHLPPEAIPDNRDVANQFLARLSLMPDLGSNRRNDATKHLWSPNVPLQPVVDELLEKLRFGLLEDSQRFAALQILLDAIVKKSKDAVCAVYYMSRGGDDQTFMRKRSLDNRGRIKNLFQGPVPVEAANRGSIYPGDREIGPDNIVRIQVHHLNIHDEDDALLAEDVTAVAVCVPEELARELLVQHQPGQASNG